ncbi:MAG: DEAD/DEAH box helicase [Dehalococcoidia bacterium]
MAILERPAAPPQPITTTTTTEGDNGAPAPSERSRRRRSRGPRRDGTATQEQPGADTPELPRPVAAHSEHFRALGVDAVGLDAIASLGYDRPTPIQEAALPLLNDGGDLVGIAQTGTGKTIAFGLPLARTIDPSVEAVQAIVLVPTRELAAQVRDVMDLLGRFYGFHVLGLMGGSRVATDLRALERGTHVVVGTPGRVIDHLQRGTLDLRNVHFVVLDEADQMLDIGFARDIDRILRNVPKERQTALFSATMPESISRIVYRYMRDARRVSITPEKKTVENVVQQYCEVAERDKIRALQHLYETTDLGRSLIFRRTKIGVDRLTEQLQRNGIAARAIHGDLRQGERDRVMADFKSGNLQFLIATNVAARGLDIPDIEHVINYDVPQNAEEYIHRIGRTARAGKRGLAITFVGEWELEEWDRIVTTVGADRMDHLKIPPRAVSMGASRRAEATA